MSIFTKDKVYFSADRATYLQYDGGTEEAKRGVNGVEMLTASDAAVSFGVAPNALEPVETVTAANVITASETGKTFFLSSATEFASTLPAPAAGLKFRFVVKAAPSGASYTVVTASSANVIIGSLSTSDIDGAADADAETAGDTITFADGVAVAGDWVEVVSDGTSWYLSGHCKTYNGITLSQAS